MPKIYDLIGERFGKLLVIDCVGTIRNGDRSATFWECMCDCGNTTVVRTAYLMNGSTRSCGCLVAETARKSSYRDLTGKRFGMLTAQHVHRIDGKVYWKCKCECGNERVIATGRLTTGSAYSCGCVRRKIDPRIKHGMANTRIYAIFKGMRARCTNENHPYYKNYGGRGIKVCDEWMADDGFEKYYKWSMENGYAEDLSIDRIDNDGNYEPSNCRWVDNKTQSNNTSTNRRFVFMGKEYTMAQISDMTNVPYRLISRRISRGWSIEDAINVPLLGGHDLQEYKAGLVESTGV